MNIKDISLKKIKPYKKNAKLHPDDQVQFIANSIKEFGWKQPIVLDKDNVIVIGHGRFLAAKKLGLDSAPCIYADDLSEDQIKALRLADNKTNESEWDLDLLDIELDDIIDIDMEQFGFDMSEFEDEEPVEIVEDEVPEEVETRCKLGDLWQLGWHRLICGNSTDPAVIDRLMDGVKADMVFTDPPYNVNMQRSASIKNDNLKDEDYHKLLINAVKIAKTHCSTNNMYWWIGFKEYSNLEGILKQEHIDIANCIVWDKGSIGLGGKGYRYQHELCLFSGETNNNSESDVWQFKRDNAGLHPTMKPIELIAYAIKNIDGIKSVLDMFGGSGSTLIACEQLNRKCYMAELDPKYCDVIIQRWENFTGRKAELLNV